MTSKLVTLTLKPSTKGTIYTISQQDYYNGAEPSQELHHSHPFQGLWRDFLTTITTPMKCDRVVDAFVTIFANGVDWPKELTYSQVGLERDKIVKLLRYNPPNLLIINQPPQAGLGVHIASPRGWQYIAISEYLVEQWTKAHSITTDFRYTLVLEAIIKATIIHQLASWMLAISTGNIPENSRPTVKVAETTWAKETGSFDAGDYVEVSAGGGVFGFDTERDDVFVRGGLDQVWSPRTSFLRAFREKGYARFRPDVYDVQTNSVTAMPAFLQTITRQNRLPISFLSAQDLFPRPQNALVHVSKTVTDPRT